MFLQVQSQKPSSAMTGSHEDRHRKGRPRVTSAAEDMFIRVTSLRNSSPNKCFTEFKSETHLNINYSEETVWFRPSWSDCCTESTTKGHLAWDKKHEQWTLDRWKSVLWSESKFDFFWFQLPYLCETQSRWTDDLSMCGSHREAWRRKGDGEGVLCWWHCLWFIYNWRHT